MRVQLPATSGLGGRVVVAGTTGYHDGFANINPMTVTLDLNAIYLSLFPGWWSFGYYTPATSSWGCESSNCLTATWRVLAWR